MSIQQVWKQASEEDFETKIKYKSTVETGEYIELEVVNQSRDILESGFDDELESTVEVGNYVESKVFDDSKEELESNPEWFSSPKEN